MTTDRVDREGRQSAMTRESGDLPSSVASILRSGDRITTPGASAMRPIRRLTMTATHILNSAVTTSTATKATSKADIRVGAFLSALLGATMIFAVGFSHIDVFHNAAHDTRHSNAFPCH